MVHRYMDGTHMPGKTTLQKIYIATGGMVTPNDFCECSHDLFEPVELIAPGIPGVAHASDVFKKRKFDFKGQIMTSFEHLELDGGNGGSDFDLKCTAIHWLVSGSDSLKLACEAKGYEPHEIKEQAIRVLGSQAGTWKGSKDILN